MSETRMNKTPEYENERLLLVLKCVNELQLLNLDDFEKDDPIHEALEEARQASVKVYRALNSKHQI